MLGRFIGVLALAGASFACSSADFQTASPSDATPHDDTLVEAGDGPSVDARDETNACIVPPAATNGETSLCNALATYYSRCGHCEACVQTNENNCIEFGAGLSEAYKNAFVACKDEVACGADVSKLGSDPCIHAQLASQSLSSKQMEAKAAYCKACPSNAIECANFFGASGDTPPDAGVAGAGAFVLVGSDESVQQMIASCSGGLNCNATVYLLCTGGYFCSPMPKDACGSNFCNK